MLENGFTFDITDDLIEDTKEDSTDALEVALREVGIASSNMDLGVYIFDNLDTRDAALLDRDCIAFVSKADFVVGFNRLLSRWYDDYVSWKSGYRMRPYGIRIPAVKPCAIRITYVQDRDHQRGCKCGKFHLTSIKQVY